METPIRYGNWDFQNQGFEHDGSLISGYIHRLDNILKKADELNMVGILGLFYFGHHQRIVEETAIKRAMKALANWLHDKKYHNGLLEMDNETQGEIKHYNHEILLYQRVHQLILLAKSIERNTNSTYQI